MTIDKSVVRAGLRDRAFRAWALMSPYVILAITIFWPIAGALAIPVISLLPPAQRPRIQRVCLIAASLAAVLLFVAVLIGGLDGIAFWLMVRALALVVGVGIARAPGRRILQYAERIGDRVEPIAIGVALLAIVVSILPFFKTIVSGSVFGDAETVLEFIRLGPSLAPRLFGLLQVADGLVGVWLVFAILQNWKASRAASVFAAACWFIAGGRLAPQAMGFQPTFLIPLFLLYWPRIASRGTFAALIAAVAAALIAPQLVIPIAIIVASDMYRRQAARDEILVALPALAVSILMVLFSPIALFRPYAYIIGPLADAVIRPNGGDGSYPWEWLYPSTIGAIGASAAVGWQVAAGHFGNAWQRCASGGWIVIVLFAGGLAHVLRRNASLRRFAIFGVAVSVWAALPSHVNGTPLPDPMLALSLIHASGATGAYAGLGGVLALILLAGIEIDALLASRVWPLRYVVYPCLILLLVFSPVSSDAFWSPSATPLAHQLQDAISVCPARIGFVPGYQGEEPLLRSNELTAINILSSAGEPRSRLISLPFGVIGGADGRVSCLVVDTDQEGRYATAPLSDAIILPSSMLPPALTSIAASTRYLIPAWRIESLEGSVVLYRR